MDAEEYRDPKKALQALLFFTREIIAVVGIDPAETAITVRSQPSGRALANVSLSDLFTRCDAIIEEADHA